LRNDDYLDKGKATMDDAESDTTVPGPVVSGTQELAHDHKELVQAQVSEEFASNLEIDGNNVSVELTGDDKEENEALDFTLASEHNVSGEDEPKNPMETVEEAGKGVEEMLSKAQGFLGADLDAALMAFGGAFGTGTEEDYPTGTDVEYTRDPYEGESNEWYGAEANQEEGALDAGEAYVDNTEMIDAPEVAPDDDESWFQQNEAEEKLVGGEGDLGNSQTAVEMFKSKAMEQEEGIMDDEFEAESKGDGTPIENVVEEKPEPLHILNAMSEMEQSRLELTVESFIAESREEMDELDNEEPPAMEGQVEENATVASESRLV
jgi:hypothetical protein